jgi:protease IV
MRRLVQLAFLYALPGLTGCVVIPIGDLLKGPELSEQVLIEGTGIFGKEKVAIIDVEGVVRSSESSSLLFPEESTLREMKARLDAARYDPEVKAVVLRISSPGGEVTACDILHQEVMRLRRDRKIPVIASILDQGTSGAYYIAAAADRIIAHPTSVVGSIGVILYNLDLSGLLGKIGVTAAPIKSSDKKDLNSPFRPMTPEERAVLQRLVDDLYQRFVTVVDEGRSQLGKEEVLAIADGRVVSGIEAERLKLVDRTGYLSDAIEEAARAAGIETPTVVQYTRIARSGASIYGIGPEKPAARELRVSLDAGMLSVPKLYYLWHPGL